MKKCVKSTLCPAYFSYLFHCLPRVKSWYHVIANLDIMLITSSLPWIYLYLSFKVHKKHAFYSFWHNQRSQKVEIVINSFRLWRKLVQKNGIFQPAHSRSTEQGSQRLHSLGSATTQQFALSSTFTRQASFYNLLRAQAVSLLHDIWKQLVYSFIPELAKRKLMWYLQACKTSISFFNYGWSCISISKCINNLNKKVCSTDYGNASTITITICTNLWHGIIANSSKSKSKCEAGTFKEHQTRRKDATREELMIIHRDFRFPQEICSLTQGWIYVQKNLKLSTLKSGYSETVCPDQPENLWNCLSKLP